MSDERIFINCPFDEKDEAKKQGAKWDSGNKKWFIPKNLYNQIEHFNQWKPKGRMYLNCPFSDKDKAKKKGAKWDRAVGKWFFIPGKDTNEKKFEEWLPGQSSCESSKSSPQMKVSSSSIQSCSRKDSSKTSSITKKSSSVAALPRINKDMTLKQLQHECQARDPALKGISNKNKQWFLEHLGIGSVWTSIGSTEDKSREKKVTPKQGSEKKRSAESVVKESPSKKKPKMNKIKNEDTKFSVKAKTASKPRKNSKKGVDISLIKSLPRISSSLTVAQLTHELHHRNPSTTGTSNKNKQWFLDQLGLGSIWMSSVEAKDLDTSELPTISSSLTVAQLLHELLERIPSQSGTSGKKKEWYLERLCLGTVWITGLEAEGKSKEKTASKAKTKVASKSIPTKQAPVKLKSLEENTSLKTKMDLTPASSQVTHSQRTKADNSNVNSARPLKQENKSPPVSSIPMVISSMPIAQVKEEWKVRDGRAQKKVASKNTQPRKVPVKLELLEENPSLKTTTETTSASSQVTLSQRTKANNSNVNSARPLKEENKTSPKVPSIPTVSSSMTIAQLKEECKVRDGKVKGLSGKNKAWFLDYLVEGTEVESSLEWQKRYDKFNEDLHKYNSICHAHPLADSTALRAPQNLDYGTRSSQRRADCAVCDIEHRSFCQQTAFRSCEKCNFDICKACFELESLPQSERKKVLDAKREALKKKREEKERQFREQMRQIKEQQRLEEQRKDRIRREEKARREKKYKTFLAKFPENVRNPIDRNTNIDKKLKYSVWTSKESDSMYTDPPSKEFNSSYDTIDDANLRVEYVFYYDNKLGVEKDDICAHHDTVCKSTGMRNMDDRDRDWTVSVVPTVAFDYLNLLSYEYHLYEEKDRLYFSKPIRKSQTDFEKEIRHPTLKHKNEKKKLQYTVWTLDSFRGFLCKKFNSSFNSLEQANERAEYVFYFENAYERNALHDEVYKSHGTRFLYGGSEDGKLLVSVVPSDVFPYIYNEFQQTCVESVIYRLRLENHWSNGWGKSGTNHESCYKIFHTKKEALLFAPKLICNFEDYEDAYGGTMIDYRDKPDSAPNNGVVLSTEDMEGQVNAVHIEMYESGGENKSGDKRYILRVEEDWSNGWGKNGTNIDKCSKTFSSVKEAIKYAPKLIEDFDMYKTEGYGEILVDSRKKNPEHVPENGIILKTAPYDGNETRVIIQRVK